MQTHRHGNLLTLLYKPERPNGHRLASSDPYFEQSLFNNLGVPTFVLVRVENY